MEDGKATTEALSTNLNSSHLATVEWEWASYIAGVLRGQEHTHTQGEKDGKGVSE